MQPRIRLARYPVTTIVAFVSRTVAFFAATVVRVLAGNPRNVVLMCAVTFAVAIMPRPALAGLVGTIRVTEYMAVAEGSSVGVDMVMHYERNGNFANQNCCDQAQIRFLQRATVALPIQGFTTMPNETLIDLRQGQRLGNSLFHRADDSPFYDLTFPTANYAIDLRNFGIGPHYLDEPRVPLDLGQMLSFETLVVCEQANKMLGILGGLSWGFTVGADAHGLLAMPKPVVALAETPALITAFNADLANDFPGWTIKPAATLWPAADLPTFDVMVVPEPAALALIAVAIGMIVGWRVALYAVNPFCKPLGRSKRDGSR